MKAWVVGLVLLAWIVGQVMAADRPPDGFQLQADRTVTSPDKRIAIEQYRRVDDHGDYTWQVWSFDKARREAVQLNFGENLPYPAYVWFTPDSRWLVRSQKIGAGTSALYLYRRLGNRYVPAQSVALDELAWQFFRAHDDSKNLVRMNFHQEAYLLADSTTREPWSTNQSLAIGLSGQNADVRPHQGVYGWHCRYDLETGAFYVPPEYAASNAQAIDQSTHQ